MTLVAQDRRAGDLDNKFASIADLLVDAGIIEDDNWNVIRKQTLIFGGVDKEKCGVTIEISPIA